jgi:hypothetical protein
MRPFSSADHMVAWSSANCCRCVHYDAVLDGPAECQLQNAVETCALDPDAGRLALRIGGTRPDGLIADRCPWIEFTDEAKAANSARATLPLFGGDAR